MMHGREKSDLVIVAMKPANKARKAHRGGIRGGGRSGVGGAKGGGQGEYAPAKHVLDSEPGSRGKGAGAYTARGAVIHPRQEPLERHKASLERLLGRAGSGVQLNEHLDAEGPIVFSARKPLAALPRTGAGEKRARQGRSVPPYAPPGISDHVGWSVQRR